VQYIDYYLFGIFTKFLNVYHTLNDIYVKNNNYS